MFQPLTRGQISQIVGLQLERLSRQLAEQATTLEVTDAARDAIAEEGYDPTYGARPLKRVIQQQLHNPLSTQILQGTIHEGSHITVDFDGDRFCIDSVNGVATQQ